MVDVLSSFSSFFARMELLRHRRLYEATVRYRHLILYVGWIYGRLYVGLLKDPTLFVYSIDRHHRS